MDFDSRPIYSLLYDTAYARIGLVPGTDVILFQQGAESIPNPEIEATWVEIEKSLSGIVRSTHALMLDVRKARGRNDPEFERLFAPIRARITSGWRRVAIVVLTAPGFLQVQRYAREDNLDLEFRIFETPNAAFVWLQGEG